MKLFCEQGHTHKHFGVFSIRFCNILFKEKRHILWYVDFLAYFSHIIVANTYCKHISYRWAHTFRWHTVYSVFKTIDFWGFACYDLVFIHKPYILSFHCRHQNTRKCINLREKFHSIHIIFFLPKYADDSTRNVSSTLHIAIHFPFTLLLSLSPQFSFHSTWICTNKTNKSMVACLKCFISPKNEILAHSLWVFSGILELKYSVSFGLKPSSNHHGCYWIPSNTKQKTSFRTLVVWMLNSVKICKMESTISKD